VPDRPGNDRVDSFNSAVVNSKVGILFLIPGHSHSLRVNGTAQLSPIKSAAFDTATAEGMVAESIAKRLY
jgi:hypothetical protein